jgi:hypothetical protein
MQLEQTSATGVHPVIAALEKADVPTVVIDGFLGTSKDGSVRLYQALDTSGYVEIPKEAVIHLEPDKEGEPGAFRAFVRASGEILSVQRTRIRALDWVGVPVEPIPKKEFPTPKTCAGFCEDAFKPRVTAYFIAETRALREQNSDRQALLLNEAQALKAQAKDALYRCLTECARRNPRQYIFGIDSTYQAILERNHMDDPE